MRITAKESGESIYSGSDYRPICPATIGALGNSNINAAIIRAVEGHRGTEFNVTEKTNKVIFYTPWKLGQVLRKGPTHLPSTKIKLTHIKGLVGTQKTQNKRYGTKEEWAKQRKELENSILEVAFKMFEEKGYAKTSVSAITVAVGYPKGSSAVATRFKSKQNLYNKAYEYMRGK